MLKNQYWITIVLIIVSCSIIGQDLRQNNKNELGLSLSDIDPIGLCYNRICFRNNKFDITIKSGFLYWKNEINSFCEYSILHFSLKPSVGLSILKYKKMSFSILAGILNNYELDIYKNGLTNKTTHLNEINGVEDLPYKYPQYFYMAPSLSVQLTYGIVRRIRFSLAIGPKTQFRWIVKPEPIILNRFMWTDKISLGMLFGIYYNF